MNKFNIEDGELEMLALGQLSARREQELFLLLEQNESLMEEYEAIQMALENLAFENAVSSPAASGANIHSRIFSDKNSEGKTIPFYRLPVFRLAASILFIGSILANIYLLRGTGKEELTRSESVETEQTRKEAFMAALPMEVEEFDKMFNYLQASLEQNPCDMKFTVTRKFLNEQGLNADAIVDFLFKEGGHCDCEVLMNVSMQFPQEPYKHGTVPQKTHREADIKLTHNLNEDNQFLASKDLVALAYKR